MNIRKRTQAPFFLLLIAASMAWQTASAAGVQAVIRTAVEVSEGITSGNIELFLNDTPLPVVPEQTVTLGLFDTLRAETSASATHESGLRVLSDQRVTIDLILDSETVAATVQTQLSGTAETTPISEGGFETGTGSTGGGFNCDFTNGACTAVGLPQFLSFNSGLDSTTIGGGPNRLTINNVTTETGRVGGPETFDLLVNTLNLEPPEGDGLQTFVSVGAQGLAIFESTSSASATLDVVITDLAIIPLPAGVWLFASALGLLGWIRRKTA